MLNAWISEQFMCIVTTVLWRPKIDLKVITFLLKMLHECCGHLFIYILFTFHRSFGINPLDKGILKHK
jgi:hypothetical protein